MLLRRLFSGGRSAGSSASTSSTSTSRSSRSSRSATTTTTTTTSTSSTILKSLLLLSVLSTLPTTANAGDILETQGFSTCLVNNELVVTRMAIRYDRDSQTMKFDVAGTSLSEQHVTAVLQVSAYGRNVYSTEFDPCKKGIEQLCPIPQGIFSADDLMTIPPELAANIPDIAFKVPDLDGVATLILKKKDDGTELACLRSVVRNGKTASNSGAKAATAGMAAAAMMLSGIGALGAGGGATAAGVSPNFGDVMFWFQSIATDGMLSLSYPSVYRSFTDNFQWSTGLVSWDDMQRSIDNFRAKTGGNTTEMSIEWLLKNRTLVYDKDLSNGTVTGHSRRSLEWPVTGLEPGPVIRQGAGSGAGTGAGAGEHLWQRDISASSNTTESPSAEGKMMQYANGIKAKVETLMVPNANTFMTVLLIFCILVASICVCILLFKVVLEVWALFGSFPKSLTGFRKRYWLFLMSTIVRIILVLYGTWTLYCFYQFKSGDSWGAHLLAALTLLFFTGVLGFFAYRIFTVARAAKKSAEGQEQLFIHKPYMRKYGIFYDQYKSETWWIFLPLIIYAFAKGAIIALGDGHGLVQTLGQLTCEMALLILLLWNRPYNTKAGNILNIIISCVRVLSVVCLIVFVDQLGIAPDTKTVTGVALIAIQSVLTGVLAICILVNAIYGMIKENPHHKKRKEQEKLREEQNLTALDARNSLLYGGGAHDGKGQYQPISGSGNFSSSSSSSFFTNTEAYGSSTTAASSGQIQMQDNPYHHRNFSSASGRGLIDSAAPMPSSSPNDRSPLQYDNSTYSDPNHHQQGGPYEDYRNQYPPSAPGAARY
ncbi:hypothetical protein BZA77DRAFT_239545 [Pyronema omphalodes]|nr:hypothetical protein BZA77DRAFT_239545 [Pyronema omphalodes]